MRMELGWLLALACAGGSPVAGEALEIFVSNEKGNTITIIDGDKLELIETVPVGNRPRGIALSRDGALALHLRLGRRHDPGHRHRDPQDRGHAALRPRSRAAGALARRRADLRRQRGRQHGHGRRHRAARTVLTEIPVGVEPEGMGVSHDGKWMVNTSETTNMAHFIDTDTLEITDNVLVDQRPRFAEWTSDDAEVWVSAEIGGTVSVIDNATRADQAQDHLRDAGRAARGDPAGRRADHRRTAAWPSWRSGRPTGSRWSTRKTYEVEDYLLVGQRVWQLALQPGREVPLLDQRRLQRHLGDRRRGPRGRQVGPGRPAALGRRRQGLSATATDQRQRHKGGAPCIDRRSVRLAVLALVARLAAARRRRRPGF